MNIIKFTKKQIEFLTHRPEDCLAEVMVNSDYPHVSLKLAHTLAWELITGLEKRKSVDLSKLSRIQRDMLKDCIEGSTYQCATYAEDEAQYDRDIKCMYATAAKLEPFLGRIDVPKY
jgi:hypothetical protein